VISVKESGSALEGNSETSHEVDGTGERSMAGKERWTEIVQMETEQAESGRSQSRRESDMYMHNIHRVGVSNNYSVNETVKSGEGEW
jgi:hypothetical protein